MRAICPISGIPFRTYDSLPVKVAYPHPIFSLTYDQLIYLLDIIKDQEQQQIEKFTDIQDKDYEFVSDFSIGNKMTSEMIQAIQERNWTNPVFKLYQTKHLTMLAFMKLACLLENEEGYVAIPNPHITEAYFWLASELFIWACAIRNPQTMDMLPKYKVSKHNEDMGNFKEYLNILADVKQSIGERYRTREDDRRIDSMQKALTILSMRRNIQNIALTKGSNKLAAQWALMVTRPPKDLYKFWFAILSSPSTQITFEGVKVDDKYEIVTPGDLRELKDFLEDNLIGPRGDEKSIQNKHQDDSEYYFVSRQTVLGIIRKHIAILEQGTAGYQIVNAALGAEILSSTDDQLHDKAINAGLKGRPMFGDYPTKIGLIKAMATWRLNTKQLLLDLANMSVDGKVESEVKKEGAKYEIL